VQSAGGPASRIHLRLTEKEASILHDIVKSFNTNRVQSCYLNSRCYVLFGSPHAKCNTLARISYIRLRQISRSRLVHISSNENTGCLVLLAKEKTVQRCMSDRVI